MKYVLSVVIAVFATIALTAFTACGRDDGPFSDTEQTGPDGNKPECPGDNTPGNPDGGDENNGNPMNPNLKITVSGTTFTATLENNATARAFAARLPMTVEMGELNGNEKYYYLNEDLPVNASRPETIRAGDLMLYGATCFVLFYETFSSPYSYTRIGRVNDPSGLASAVGRGSVTVTFRQ